MKETDRLRIEQSLLQIEQWRASGQTLASYVQQRGETVKQWRGKISWEKRWRNLLQGKTASGLEIDNARTRAFVKATPAATTRAANQRTVSTTHLRITLTGAGGNRIENLIRPWALGRKNWLFTGSLAAGQRAADIMSLIQSAKMNGLEPLAYLSDVLNRLPTHPNSRIAELLPTGWKPACARDA